jgi:hypothetical protein
MTLEKDTIEKAGCWTNRAAVPNCHPRTDIPRQAAFAFYAGGRRIKWPKHPPRRTRGRKKFANHEKEALQHMARHGDECAEADLFRFGYANEAIPTAHEAP